MTCLSDYDKFVTIKRLVGTADAHGHIDLTTNANWSIYATAYCKVITKGGREFWKVQQVNADSEQAWTAQWSTTLQEVTPDMRLEYDGNVYEILSAIDVNMDHEEIQILTRRKI